MEDEPIAICLVFDASSSMGGTLRQARQAALLFFHEANPGDEFCLVEFNDSPHLGVPLTDDPRNIRTELMMTRAKGSTALVDGVILGIHELKKSKLTRKAIVLVSDGGDNHSRYTPRELQSIVKESEALIFSIAVLGSDYDPAFLRGLADQTGGRMFIAAQVSVAEVAAKIIIELRNRYVLGYSPTNPARDGQYRKVELKLKPPRGLPKLNAHWRRGYYARQN
jgi:VWFA-related protein